MAVSLNLAGLHHDQLRRHLFPGDGKEAAAIVLCGRRAGAERHRLVGQEVLPIPHEACLDRSFISIEWSTDLIEPWLRRADASGLSVVKVHSHPGYWPRFSKQDDRSDRDLFPCIDGAIEAEVPHASVIMLPDGSMIGRVVTAAGNFEPLESITVAGDDLRIWRSADFDGESALVVPGFAKRHAQAFGAKTTADLGGLAVAVIGCSGTGSPIVAQLAHLGVRRLVLVDPDSVLEHNLNRIVYATAADIGRFKVDVLGDSVEKVGLGTAVERWPVNLYSREAIQAVAACDVVIGCSDTAEARFLINLISNFYVMAYIDVGVTLETEREGEISQVCGYVHYLQPGRSSVLSRGVITLEEVRAEGMRRQNPDFYEEQRKAGYIQGVDEDRPAVISVNMQFAALAVTELIARINGFRENPNRCYAKIGMSLSEVAYYPEPEPVQACRYMARQVGRGDIEPPLNLAELSG